MSFITISRQAGSLGHEITELAARKLGVPIISRDLVMREWFPDIASKHELHMLAESPGFFLTSSSQGQTFAQFLELRLREFLADQPAIILGLGGQIIFANDPTAVHVRIMATPEVRKGRIMEKYSLDDKDAARLLELTDRKHKRYISTLYERDWGDPALYHITLNTDFISVEGGASLLAYLAENKQSAPCADSEATKHPAKAALIFKHPSEEEFAKILDMHKIEWEYEPRTFPIKWDSEGNITQAFSPDFYLPRFDSFIELTTMNNKYTSEKKKKIQLLRKLYPGTNVNIVFKNDFHKLAKRFGLEEESD